MFKNLKEVSTYGNAFPQKIMCVYSIICNINSKTYVGITNNHYNRWRRHMSYLKAGNHPNKYLQEDFNKYGEDKFTTNVLVNLNEVSLVEETKWINHYVKLGLNYNYTPEEKNRLVHNWKWSDKPESLARMKANLKVAKRKFRFEQYTREGILIKTWDSVDDIITENPNYKWQNIYSVCNGYKKTYMNFVWKKILKI